MADQNLLGQIWGSLSAGAVEGTKNLFGIKREGFYNNTYDPATGQLYGVDPKTGEKFAISPDEMNASQREYFGRATRRSESRQIRADVIEQGERQFGNQVKLSQLSNAPVLAQIQASLQSGNADRALQRERDDKQYQLALKEAETKGEWNKLQGIVAMRGVQLAENNRADALANQKRQYDLDVAQLQYASDLARHNQIMNAFGSLGRGLAAVL